MVTDTETPFDNSEEPESDLDPRIQIELEALNNATDDINKLETELDESNQTFRILMNESTRRLKILSRQLGSCIERARPYYEALDIAKQAQQECQKAAVKFQRANEIHQAAKETVALAEARFLSKKHEWKFDSAWQEMLNNAIIKVTDAENAKSESGREHQKKATLFNAAEHKVQILEQKLKRNIIKSRPYFEEKALCESQLNTQKERVLELRDAVKDAKRKYSASLRHLEDISEEIHMRRRRESTCDPTGPREPGVGAELTSLPQVETLKIDSINHDTHSLDIDFDLDKCDARSIGGSSVTTSSRVSNYDSGDEDLSPGMDQEDLEKLRKRVRELATTPTEGWESELDATVNKLDNMLHLRECEEELKKQREELKQSSPTSPLRQKPPQYPTNPFHQKPQSPTSPYQQKPQSPTSPYQQKPHSPSSPYQQKPHSPSSPYQQKPHSPSSPFKQTTQSPPSPFQKNPQSPTTPFNQTTQSPTSPYQQKPHSPSSPLKQNVLISPTNLLKRECSSQMNTPIKNPFSIDTSKF